MSNNSNNMSGGAAEIEIKASHQITLWSGNDVVIAKYQDLETKKTFVACGTALPQSKEVTAILSGGWRDSKHGKQFKVVSHSIELPTSEAGVVSYLASLKVSIGPVKAKAIYKRFGERTWDVISDTPEELLKVNGISLNIIDKLKSKLLETSLLRDILSLFKGAVEITPRKANVLVKNFGKDVMRVLKEEPYLICDLPEFGFQSVDRVGKSVGISPDSPARLLASIEHIFSDAAVHGHTCVPKAEFVNCMMKVLNAGYDKQVVTEAHCQAAIKAAWQNGKVVSGSGYLYSSFRHKQEATIAERIAEIMKDKSSSIDNVDAFVVQYEKENSIELAHSQREAVSAVFKNPVNIITGGPGTGKTTTIKAVLYVHQLVYGSSSNPLLLAPTGRAARRMSDATGTAASTIHSAIGFRGEKENEDVEDAEMTLDSNLFIVDEVSMMDQFIASSLLNKIPKDARIVFVGDPEQLPSVGCGNVLHEMIRSQVIPTTRLKVIFRQAQDNPIVANSQSIQKGDANLTFTNTFKLIEGSSAEEIFDSAVRLYLKCVRAYGIDNVILLNPYREKTTLAVDAFNRTLQGVINPKVEGAPVIKVRDLEFRKGDKIMQTKNTDSAKNGDVGYIKDIIMQPDPEEPSEKRAVAYLEFNGDGNVLQYTAEGMTHVDLAYCTTIHKSQGSEYETVIMVVSEMHSRMLRRNLVYTGITRAQKNVAIVGEKSALVKAIQNNQTDARYTLLSHRLNNKIN